MMMVHLLDCMPFTLAGIPHVTLCLLLETSDGLVLIDSGLGVKDYTHPTRHKRFFCLLNLIRFDPSQSAFFQVQRLGFDPRQVLHIVLTHAHLDHAGGLADFPWARVHLLAAEYDAAMHPHGWVEHFGYAGEDWAHGPNWQQHKLQGDRWLGLEGVRVVENPPVWLVPLAGHSRGHCGVAVGTPTGWVLHCGDAFLRDSQVDPVRPHSPFPLWSRLLIEPLEKRMCPPETLTKVRMLLANPHNASLRVFCSHDPTAFRA